MTRGRVRIALAGLALLASAATGLSAQQTATIAGRVLDDGGIPIQGVHVVAIHQVTGAERATFTNEDGQYLIRNLRPRGPYRIEARRIGYGTQVLEVAGLDAAEPVEHDFVLGNEAVALDAIEVFADRAYEQQTPVAYSTVDEIQIQRQLASRDLPLVLNTKPSVYATESGGGAGDARVNVRGFSQRNVAVMINGVPVNDMENGWVYWSNWDGVGDFTKSIQLQRGLSAVNLATPSIGGSLNLITDPTTLDADLMVKQEFGNDGFWKTTASLSSGLLDDRFAVMGAVIRKKGDGIVPGGWTDAWAYYGAASYIIDDNNRLDLFATGAPQRHGQRRYAQNIGAFDAGFARSLDDYDAGALAAYPESSAGRLFNQNYNLVSGYCVDQAVGGSMVSRPDCGYMNEIENFYHKPQVNLNWYSQLTDRLKWSTVGYFSGGQGGGSGTLGSMVWDYDAQPTRVVDWNATIERNDTSSTGSRGILRNSRNNQWTFGAISKLDIAVTEPLTVQIGVDYRLAEVEHYREVRDLLGGDYFVDDSDDFNPGFQARLGDKVDYYNTNEINWIGGHVQATYYTGKYSLFGMGGVSGVNYRYTDHFLDSGLHAGGPASGQALVLDPDWNTGFQAKAGGLYNLTEEVNLYASTGYVAQMPIFDQVIDDVNGLLVDNAERQKFLSVELGSRYRPLEAPFEVAGNVYYTQWLDRSSTERYRDENNEDIFITLTGLQQRHIGLELEASYQPIDLLRFDLSASFNDWTYTDDVNGIYKPESRDTIFHYDIYVDGLKVGNAPQKQFAYQATVFPLAGTYLQLVGKSFLDHYSDFNPFDRTNACYPDGVTTECPDPGDRGVQPWQAPNYSVFDLHAGFDLPPALTRNVRVQLFANAFNVFDAVYISDALDNSSFNAFDNDHDADDAEVFFGLPRRFTLGASVTY
jgi:outer membrane receptor for Fe3+-dicitrate